MAKKNKNKQEMTFEAKVEDVEVKEMNPDMKKDTQVISNEDLEKLLPIMAGKKINEETNDWVGEVITRDVNVGAVVQIVAMMLAPTKETLLRQQYTLFDTMDIIKTALMNQGVLTDEQIEEAAKEIVAERDAAREKAQQLVKEELAEQKKKHHHTHKK